MSFWLAALTPLPPSPLARAVTDASVLHALVRREVFMCKIEMAWRIGRQPGFPRVGLRYAQSFSTHPFFTWRASGFDSRRPILGKPFVFLPDKKLGKLRVNFTYRSIGVSIVSLLSWSFDQTFEFHFASSVSDRSFILPCLRRLSSVVFDHFQSGRSFSISFLPFVLVGFVLSLSFSGSLLFSVLSGLCWKSRDRSTIYFL